MSIGSDIAEVIAETGSSIIIMRDSGNISGEFGNLELNAQATKVFIISYFKKATLQYNTSAVSGDIIRFETTNDVYLLTALNSEEFENAIVEKQGVLYLCNVSGELLRPSGETWSNDHYHKEQAWETIDSNSYALFTNPEIRNKIDQDEAVMMNIEENELYLPHSLGAAINDRYETRSGEFYKLESINSYRFFGVDMCKITEDTR